MDKHTIIPMNASVSVITNHFRAMVPYGLTHPSMKTAINAAATDGANAMRRQPPSSAPWEATHPNLAESSCSEANTNSRTADANAHCTPVHRNATVNILTSPPPIHWHE